MKGNRGAAPVRVSVLPVGSAFPDKIEAEGLKQPFHFAGLQGRDVAHYPTEMV